MTGLRIFAGLFAVLAKNSMQYLRAARSSRHYTRWSREVDRFRYLAAA